MAKKTITAPEYSQEFLQNHTKNLIIAEHNRIALEEKRAARKLYPTFGEWKAANPTHTIAKYNFPENEYLQVISSYFSYFSTHYKTAYKLSI